MECTGLIELGRDYGWRTYELEREWDNESGYLIFRVIMYFKRTSFVIMNTKWTVSQDLISVTIIVLYNEMQVLHCIRKPSCVHVHVHFAERLPFTV